MRRRGIFRPKARRRRPRSLPARPWSTSGPRRRASSRCPPRRVSAATERPALQELREPAVAAAGGRQWLSADGRHVLLSERASADSGVHRHRWTVYERGSGARLGAMPALVSATPFLVVGAHALPRLAAVRDAAGRKARRAAHFAARLRSHQGRRGVEHRSPRQLVPRSLPSLARASSGPPLARRPGPPHHWKRISADAWHGGAGAGSRGADRAGRAPLGPGAAARSRDGAD